MVPKSAAAIAVTVIALFAPGRALLPAASRADLAGRWTLNRQLSEFPRDVGFGMDLVSDLGSRSDSDGATTGGRRRGGGGGGSSRVPTFNSSRESEEDVKRREQLVDEVTNPSPHLTIGQTDAAVTMTDDRGRSRTFHPDGREESQSLDQVSLSTTTRWEGARLVVRYKVEQNRELRYTYSRTVDPPRLVVQVQFIERGGNDAITRVYEPASANERALREPAPTPVPTAQTAPGPGGTASDSALGRPAAAASPARVSDPAIPQGPDSELRGLTKVGVVVEDLSSQAAACGLSQGSIEAAVSKSLSDAGLEVRRNSDEDTYVYVQIVTTSLSAGLCVSRYDASLYTNTTATLSYHASPVLVQVLLLHKGGIAGGAAGTHGDAVVKSVKQYVDEFATRIRDANRPK